MNQKNIVNVKLNHLYSTSTFHFSLEIDEKGEVSLQYHQNRYEWHRAPASFWNVQSEKELE